MSKADYAAFPGKPTSLSQNEAMTKSAGFVTKRNLVHVCPGK